MKYEPLNLDHQLCFALYAASRAMIQTYRPALDALGLTYPQYLVMLVLWGEDDQSVKDIGARLMLDSGTLTPLLKRMETVGLIERRRDPEDERRVRILLTEAGRALRDEAHVVPESVLCKLAQLDDPYALVGLREQIKDLIRVLRAPGEDTEKT